MSYTIVEKVIFLGKVDVFAAVPTDQLAFVAAIAGEVTYLKGDVIYNANEASDAFYLVLSGQVRMDRDGQEITTLGEGDAMGTWALFDDEPRVATATALEDTRLLRIDRDEFMELLSDHTEITQGVFKTIVGRMRGLIDRVGSDVIPRGRAS